MFQESQGTARGSFFLFGSRQNWLYDMAVNVC
jgi:hypothetical protein